MLRITADNETSNRVLHLEGKLAGPWVEEVERCWRDLAPGPLTLCLDAVSFIDESGKKLLARLHASGVELQASGCMTRCIVEDITGVSKRC
jgi:hypothetical protein